MPFGFNEDKSKTDNLFDLIYPIGSIYMSVNSVNPSTLFGGTWESWGAGRVPVGVDASDTSFNTVEKTGGAKTHQLATSEIPSHTHSYSKANTPTGGTVITVRGFNIPKGDGNSGSALVGLPTSLGEHTHTISSTSTNSGSTGGGGAHNNLQPYITCYMWKRTA